MSLRYGVVIPAFNATRTLAEAIASVLGQTTRPEMIVVVDDGSTDDTAQIAASFGEPVCIISQSHQGPAAATDRGLERLDTPLVAGLDADDLWRPHKAERQLDVLMNSAEIDAVFCRAGIFAHGEKPGGARTQDLWGRSAMMIRRTAIDQIGAVDVGNARDNLGEMIRWIDDGRKLGLNFQMLSETLVDRRIIPGSLSYGQSPQSLLAMLRERSVKRRRV